MSASEASARLAWARAAVSTTRQIANDRREHFEALAAIVDDDPDCPAFIVASCDAALALLNRADARAQEAWLELRAAKDHAAKAALEPKP